jgi:hypothetical protein
MAQQLLAIVYEKRGEMQQAFDIIMNIQKNVDSIDDKDLSYMNYFVEERLNRMEEYEKQMKKLGKPLMPQTDKTTTKTPDPHTANRKK